MQIFVTGGTGLIGSRLLQRLSARGDKVVLLTRRGSAAQDRFGKACSIVEGDPMTAGPWMDRVADCDAVISLAGEGIFNRRWSAEFKNLLHESRVKTTQHVVRAIAQHPDAPQGGRKILVNASAIGYYGPHGDEEITEESPHGDDTLARLCIDWEDAARAAEPLGVRVALVRIGVVLARHGGALEQMLRPFQLFVGGPVGSGKQWMSWIHLEDIVDLFVFALDHPQAAGPINGTAPNPVTNKAFARALGKALHRPSFLPTPAFALRVLLGQSAEVVTTGQRVLPKRPLEMQFTFKFPKINDALADLLGSS